MSEILLPGVWYGEVSQLSLDELKNSLLSVQEERECILLIVEIMKKGDFSVKNLLIDLMNQTELSRTPIKPKRSRFRGSSLLPCGRHFCFGSSL